MAREQFILLGQKTGGRRRHLISLHHCHPFNGFSLLLFISWGQDPGLEIRNNPAPSSASVALSSTHWWQFNSIHPSSQQTETLLCKLWKILSLKYVWPQLFWISCIRIYKPNKLYKITFTLISSLLIYICVCIYIYICIYSAGWNPLILPFTVWEPLFQVSLALWCSIGVSVSSFLKRSEKC